MWLGSGPCGRGQAIRPEGCRNAVAIQAASDFGFGGLEYACPGRFCR